MRINDPYTLPNAIMLTAPVSAWASGTSAGASHSSRSAALASSSERCCGVVCDHAGKAAAAAAAAASASAADASGARPTTSSVAGFTTSYVPLEPSTASPPIQSLYGLSVRTAVSAMVQTAPHRLIYQSWSAYLSVPTSVGKNGAAKVTRPTPPASMALAYWRNDSHTSRGSRSLKHSCTMRFSAPPSVPSGMGDSTPSGRSWGCLAHDAMVSMPPLLSSEGSASFWSQLSSAAWSVPSTGSMTTTPRPS